MTLLVVRCGTTLRLLPCHLWCQASETIFQYLGVNLNCLLQRHSQGWPPPSPKRHIVISQQPRGCNGDPRECSGRDVAVTTSSRPPSTMLSLGNPETNASAQQAQHWYARRTHKLQTTVERCATKVQCQSIPGVWYPPISLSEYQRSQNVQCTISPKNGKRCLPP